MEDIYKILGNVGVEIPEEKKSDFEKSLFSNYKTVAELDGIKNKYNEVVTERDTIKTKYDTDITSRDNDLAKLKEALSKADTSGETVKDLQEKLDNLTNTYATEKTKYEAQLTKQKYEFAVREKVNSLKFTSNSAKKAFLDDVMQKNLPMDNNGLLGFDDYVTAYKAQDAGAFVVENTVDNTKSTPTFTTKTTNLHTDTTIQPEVKPRPKIW